MIGPAPVAGPRERSTPRSTQRALDRRVDVPFPLGLAVHLQAIALVAGLFTAFLVGIAVPATLGVVLVGLTATAGATGLVLLLLAQFRTRTQRLLDAEAAARAQAEQSAALLDMLFEKAPVGLAVVDPQLRYLRVNQRLAEIQGRSARDHLGQTVAETSPTLGPALARGFQAALEGQTGHDELADDSPAAPGPRDLQVSYYPIRVGDAVVAAGGMVLDVTEHRQIERELEEAIRVRDDFISVASHELKTPLTSLRLNLDVLLSAASGAHPLTPEKLHRRLEIVDRVADRLQQLIEELLNITRVTSGHMGLALAPVDLAEVIDDVIARLASQLADARCPVNAILQRPVLGHWDKTAAGSGGDQPGVERHQIRRRPADRHLAERERAGRGAGGARPGHRHRHRGSVAHLPAVRAGGVHAQLRRAGHRAVAGGADRGGAGRADHRRQSARPGGGVHRAAAARRPPLEPVAEPDMSSGAASTPDLNALAAAARARFAASFGRSPTLLVAAPGRVNLIGEHTDYNDGFVLPMAIDRHLVAAAAPAAGRRWRVVSAQLQSRAEIAPRRPVRPRRSPLGRLPARRAGRVPRARAWPCRRWTSCWRATCPRAAACRAAPPWRWRRRP